MSEYPKSPLTRRTMIKGTAASLAAATAGGYATGQTPGEGTSRGGRTGDRPILRRSTLEAELVVVGGGMAGVCAAIAAARQGVSVILVQNRPVLGGNASSEIRMHIVGAPRSGGRTDTDARESGIIEELRLDDAVRNGQRSASMFDLLLHDAVTKESNITLLLNTHCTGVTMGSGRRIEAVHACRHSTEDEFTIRARYFVDASGDGRLGVEAGADYRMGREGRDEYGESIAPPQADGKTLGSTLLFITREHDRPMPFMPPDWIRRFPTCDDLPHRSHHSWEYGYWWVEWGGELDTIKDDERIRDELLAASLGVWDHIKNSGQHPQSANWALDWLGFLPGKRESRRFLGDHVLTQQELQRGELFEDGVAYGGWAIDLHPPAGIYDKGPPLSVETVPLYNIPLGSLYSRNVSNLFMAGRNISASHVAFGSTRVMATCSVMGQAVGTAVSLCLRHNCTPRELRRNHMAELQQLLLKNDAYIIGAANNDPDDHARRAEVHASSEAEGGAARQVIDGIHRGVYADSHRWISDPGKALPQWIELRFREPKRIGEVHLVFDTGLSRPLSLTHSNAFNSRMIRGPQPETVCDYQLALLSGDNAQTVTRITENYQRKSIHPFAPQTVSGLRLTVQATHGDPSARLFEIRAYT